MQRISLIGLFVATLLIHAQLMGGSLLDDPSKWKKIASDGVDFRATVEGKALRIDFDFSRGAGFGGVTIDLPRDLPENYELSFNVRGEGPANNLEVKLVDESKLNVWWVNRRAFEWPTSATRLSNRKRHFQFAWGPAGGDKPLARLGSIELIIAANEGGKGTVWIEDLRFTPLAPEKPYTGTPKFSASSNWTGALPWTAASGDKSPMFTIDFGEPRDIGGLWVFRRPESPPGDFDVQFSDDSQNWTTIRPVRASSFPLSEIALPDLQTRYLRLAFARDGAIKGLRFLETSETASSNAFWRLRAARSERGLYPCTLRNEQSFWTVIGQPDDEHEALINEQGQIEVDRKSFSIEPFIRADGKLLTWADATSHEQSLRDGWMPIPTVVRKHDGLELSITALATNNVTIAAYTIHNMSASAARGQLVLAIRPIQVLPPWQDLNITGGWTPIKSLESQRDRITVNGRYVVAGEGDFNSCCSIFDEGDPIERLASRQVLMGFPRAVECPQRSASGVLFRSYELEPGASATYVVRVARDGNVTDESFDRSLTRAAADWSSRIDHVRFNLPSSAKQFADTIRATQAYILINHDGKGFQPGSRTYERSWIRDGSMTSAAMLEFGHDDLVKRFIDWYAPFQFDSGKVPCVVDRRGADPTPENDSHGQLIWLIANAYRFTGDAELVHRQFPRVKKAVEYIESLRAQRMSDEFGPNGKPRQEPNKPPVPALAFRGLVPESISHEGYSAKPMHSFWDQFYILRGLKDAAYLAQVEGDAELAQRWQKLADDFRTSLIDSIRIAQQAHGIDYLPGCVELGDFDSTSSTILLWPVDEASRFPREWIDATFERYWNEFTRRRDSTTWDAYTPYELRHVGAFVRMGQKDRAWQALDWFFKHQRPEGWRHWAEVVWRERSTPRMIGDMPHTWVGSDFLNAARAMFVYEDQQKLVLFAGIPDAWATDPSGVGFEGLRTEFGSISASITSPAADKLVIRIEGKANPKDGFDLCSPLTKPIKSVQIDGRDAEVRNGNRVHVEAIPTTIELTY